MGGKRFLQNLNQLKKILTEDINKPLSETFTLEDYFDWCVAEDRKKMTRNHRDDAFHTAQEMEMGVANPYVLASVVLGKSRLELTPTDLMEAMNTIGNSEIPDYEDITEYQDVFNPKRGSPIFITVDLTQYISQYSHVSGSVITTDFISVLRDELQRIRHKHGEIVETRVSPKNHLKNEGVEKANPKYESLLPEEWSIVTDTLVQCDSRTREAYHNTVIQGAARDCYFLAALYSVIMNMPMTHPVDLRHPKGGIHTIPFYTYPSPTRPKDRKNVTATFPVVSATRELVYAQLTPKPQPEQWVALYEKAYAQFFNLPPPLPDSHIYNAVPGMDKDIGAFPEFDAMTPLTHLMRKIPTNYISTDGSNPPEAFPPTIFNPNNLNPDKRFDWGSDSFAVLMLHNHANGLTAYPTVAWTIGDRANSPKPELFGNPAIVENHAYSLLGLYHDPFTTDLFPAGKDCIVLRNPWGNMIDFNDTAIQSLVPYLATGIWRPDNSPSVTFGAVADGIFGLEKGAFAACFARFGWVQYNNPPDPYPPPPPPMP